MIRLIFLVLLAGMLAANPTLGEEEKSSGSDRSAISELIYAYAYRWDKKDAVGVSELFANDAVVDWVLGDDNRLAPVTGRADILSYARKAHAERLAGRQSRHFFTNIVFEEMGDGFATTRHMMLVTHQFPGKKPENVATGYYRISWTKESGVWLISRRTLFLDR